MLSGQAFHCFGGFGFKVFDPLGLIKNDQIRLETGNNSDITKHGFIVGNFKKRVIFTVLSLSLRSCSRDNLCLFIGKPFNLPLPLILQRCQGDHQHFGKTEDLLF